MQRFISQSQWERIPADVRVEKESRKWVIRKDPVAGAQAISMVVLPDSFVYPQAGDVVRALNGTFPKAGSLGVIGGNLNERQAAMFVCFAASAYRDDRTVSCSGGPVPLIKAEALVWTGEFVERAFWRWRDLPQADGGFHYTLQVPVWNWNPEAE